MGLNNPQGSYDDGSGPDPAVIRTIINVGKRLGATRSEIMAALAAGLVESGLRNLNYGDRDSEGVFQQRVSIYGRDTATDVARSAEAFFAGAQARGGEWKKGLLQTRGQGSLGERVQAVQISAFPARYGQRMDDAKRIMNRHGGAPEKPRNISLVRLGRLLENAGYDVGEHPKFGGVAPVHSDNSHHYRRDALDINWRGPGSERKRLRRLGRALENAGLNELFFPGNDPVGGHDGHLHAADTGRVRMTKALSRMLDVPLFDVPGVPDAQYVPDFDVPEYPTTPLAIGPADIARMAERRAAAQSNLRETRIASREGSQDIKQAFKRFVRDLNRDTSRGREEIMDQASDRNRAFSPAFVAPRMRDLREDRSSALAKAVSDKTEGLQDLRDAVARAKRDKSDAVDLNRRERARLQSELDRLIGV